MIANVHLFLFHLGTLIFFCYFCPSENIGDGKQVVT